MRSESSRKSPICARCCAGRKARRGPSHLPAIRQFAREYREASDTILPALAALIEAVKANPTEKQLIEETKALVERQIAVNGELIRLRNAGDNAAVAALVDQEDRAATAAIAGNLEKAVTEERRLLFAQRAESETNGMFLLAIDLAGVVLILILATVLTLSTRRSRRELQDSLSATQATNEALEAAVAERTEHLVAAHDELRLSAAVLRSTFHSMAEAVLVIDTKGEILLSNPAAEKMLRYRRGNDGRACCARSARSFMPTASRRCWSRTCPPRARCAAKRSTPRKSWFAPSAAIRRFIS